MRATRIAAALTIASALASAGAAIAQDTFDATPLAEAFVAIGCSGSEKAIFPFIGSNGLDVGTFAAQFKALRVSGNLVSDDHGETFRLTNWGTCE